MEIVNLKRLSKVFRKAQVLKGINLKINEGEIIGLIGENGAGKTTLMKCICGLVKPDGGTISYQDGKKRIGVLIEEPSVYPHLTAKQNLIFYGKAMGIMDIENKAVKLLSLVGLLQVDTKLVAEFSLGMRQRLGLAIALINDPELLILDEPINGLDPKAIVAVRKLLVALAKEQGKSILISSHILAELELMADRVCFLKRGKIIDECRSDELSHQYDSELLIETGELERAVALIREELGYEAKIVSPTTFTLLKKVIDFEKVIKILITNHIEILTISTKQGSLEEYYLQMQNER